MNSIVDWSANLAAILEALNASAFLLFLSPRLTLFCQECFDFDLKRNVVVTCNLVLSTVFLKRENSWGKWY